MRCPACTQRNSVAARNCKFCGQKFKKKGPPIPTKIIAGVAAVGLVIGLASAVGSMFSGKPVEKLKPIAERMAAGPKNPEDAQMMRVQLDAAVLKYLEQYGNLPSADLLTKLQSEVPSSAFEVLVFDLPNQMKLVELACVLQPSDYLVVPGKNGTKVSRIAGLSVYDAARLVPSSPDPTLIILGHTTGEGSGEPQFKAVSVLSSGEISDKTDKVLPPIKGAGSASFIGETPDIKIERNLVASAKDHGLFAKEVSLTDEPFTTTLKWKNGGYSTNVSMGPGEAGALYAVASSLVNPTEADVFRQQLSTEVRENIKAMEDKPVVAPGNFKVMKSTKETSRSSRSRRSRDAESSANYVLVSDKRGFEVGLLKSGRWSATSLREVAPPAPSQTVAVAAPAKTPDPQPVETPSAKIVVHEVKKPNEAKQVATISGVAAPKLDQKKREEPSAKKETKTASSKADPGTIVTETSSRVTMRSGPARNHQSIMDVPRGASVRVLSEQNKWFKISVNGREGWVYSSYVKKGWNQPSLSASTPSSSSKKESSSASSKSETASKRSEKKEKVAASSQPKGKGNTHISSSKPHSSPKEAAVEHHDEPEFVP